MQIQSDGKLTNIPLTGLDNARVTELRGQFGFNEVKQKEVPPVLLLIKKFWGISSWMLEITVAVSFLLHKTFDAYVVIVLLVFNAFIGFFNEYRATKTVAALQQKLQVMVRVLRGGKWLHLPSRELVPDDIVRVRMGDFLAADLKLLSGSLLIDKSALTGETALFDANPSDTLYSGSVVRGGEGTAVVTGTGARTFFGKTAELVLTAHHKLHMEEVVVKVVRILFFTVVSVLVITTLIGLGHGQSFISIMPLILILLVTAVPIGLPAMFTISMARGSKELSENGLLVSRLSATEDAATLTTLCVDKTGTITKNELTLTEAMAVAGFSKEEVIQYGLMASVQANEDSIDLAFFDFVAKNSSITLPSYQQLSFTPFSAASKRTEASINIEGRVLVVTKGAYSVIKALCNEPLPNIEEKVNEWAQKGFKTIAVAIADTAGSPFVLTGIVALYDPPREDAAQMLKAIKRLGIDIKMLTGDALPIAKEIARQTGIGEHIISLADVRASVGSPGAETFIYQHNGFAEVLPEDKYNIVKQLQQENQIVGMTGDGVNDAPALKQAEVGIAVRNATDVARQAASIILLKDGLQQILDLIKVGRSIHVRIVNYTVNKISKTLLTILFVCTSFVFSGQFVVSTFDMVLMLFLIDFAVLALAVDKVSWSRKPVNWNIRPLVVKGTLLGCLIFIECLSWFFFARHFFDVQEADKIHSLGFASLFYFTLFSIPVIRTDQYFYKEPISKVLLWVIAGDVVFVFVLLLFGFTGFSSLDSMVALSTLVFSLVVNLAINDPLKVLVSKLLTRKANSL